MAVVMPVFNENEWVRRSVAAARVAGTSADIELDIIVVDDGSTDRTPSVLAELAEGTTMQVITQPNAGRFAARSVGIRTAKDTWVMLLDSRVEIEQGALQWLRSQLAEHPERRVWNGHVEVQTRGNMFAAFWSGLVKIGWRRYTANPRLTSFGIADFDLYPKGAGALVIPRELLVEALDGFTSMFDDASLASDDTRLLRYVATRERIWLSPSFAFRYHGKAGVRGFLRQAFFRGTTFVDGYLGHAGAVRRALLGAGVAALVMAILLILEPLLGATLVVAALLALPIVVKVVGGTWREVGAVLALVVPFAAVFGTGLLRGVFLASVRAVRRRSVRAA
jgi:glycosyltransferase involved in cell wall biosynthesis